MSFRSLLPLLMVVLLGACGQATKPVKRSPVVPEKSVSEPVVAPAAVVIPAQPDALEVLKAVYGADFQSADGQLLEGGALAAYWTGRALPAEGGQRAYVALTHSTNAPKAPTPVAKDTVGLSAAVYVQDAQGAWRLKFKQMAFARVGEFQAPPTLADPKKHLWFNVAEGRYIWALSTRTTAPGGIGFDGIELIGIDLVAGRLSHLGHLRSGEDNAAACKSAALPDAKVACFGWQAQLALAGVSAEPGEWPALEVRSDGTRYDDKAARVVPARKQATLRFDPRLGTYTFARS